MDLNLDSKGFLDTLMGLFTSRAIEGINLLLPEAMAVLMALAVIEVCVISLMSFDAVKFRSYLGLILKFGLFLFLLQNWEDIVINQIFRSFEQAGLLASGATVMMTPSGIADVGIQLTSEVFKTIFKISGWFGIMGNITTLFLQLFLGLVVIFCFAYMAIQLFLVTVEFHIVAVLSVIMWPFGINRYTSFLSEKVIGSIFSYGVKMMAMAFVMGISVPLFQKWIGTPIVITDKESIIPVITAAVGALTLAFLTVQVPAMVQGFLAGSPSLGVGSVISSARGAVSMAATGGGIAAAGAAMGVTGASMAANRIQREAGMMMAASAAGGSTANNYGRTVLARGARAMANSSNQVGGLFDSKTGSYGKGRKEGADYLAPLPASEIPRIGRD